MARLNSARSQPNSSAIGIWKTPKLARIAKLTSMMMQPATRTGVTSGVRVCCVAGFSADAEDVTQTTWQVNPQGGGRAEHARIEGWAEGGGSCIRHAGAASGG